MDKDFPCKCGHPSILHPKNDTVALQPGEILVGYYYRMCDGCFNRNRIKGVQQVDTKDCYNYVPDNLKYLEQKYEAKSIGK